MRRVLTGLPRITKCSNKKIQSCTHPFPPKFIQCGGKIARQSAASSRHQQTRTSVNFVFGDVCTNTVSPSGGLPHFSPRSFPSPPIVSKIKRGSVPWALMPTTHNDQVFQPWGPAHSRGGVDGFKLDGPCSLYQMVACSRQRKGGEACSYITTSADGETATLTYIAVFL